MSRRLIVLILALLAAAPFSLLLASPESQSAPAELTPQQALQSITVPPGYHLELVASDPLIVNPVLCTWDGDGRMYVAELRSCQCDADPAHPIDPVSRVSLLTDSKGDGHLDRATVFADDLLLPRLVLPLDDRVLIGEAFGGKIASYRDTTGRGVADEIKVLAGGGDPKPHLEHQDTALQWGLDNYLYSTQLNRRFRFTRGTWETESISGVSSAWGLAMDDQGRLFSSSAGGEPTVCGFQQHPSYGHLTLPREIIGQTSAAPAVLGPFLPGNALLSPTTGACGPCIFRGDRLPSDLVGDCFLPEPGAHRIRRVKISAVEGQRFLTAPAGGSEFIISTDPAFQPVWAATGPDGCLYIVDLHHGPAPECDGAALRTDPRDAVPGESYRQYLGHGRIYRLVHDGFQPDPSPRLLHASSAELIPCLSHPNGWWRDTAQKLIILNADRTILPALNDLARTCRSPLGRMHALWTLEGLDSIDPRVLVEALADPDQRVRCAAARISEVFLKQGDPEVIAKLLPLLHDPSIDVVVQAIDSLRFVPSGDARPLIVEAAAAWPRNELVAASAWQSLQFNPDHPGAVAVKTPPAGQPLESLLAVPRAVLGQWTFTASDNCGEAKLAVDGDPATRWATNEAQHEGQWYQFDMGQPYFLTRLSLDSTASEEDYPRKYEVRISDDGEHWSHPVASGDGATVTTVDFPAHTVARYVRILQTTAQTGNFWSIHELSVYGAGLAGLAKVN